MFRIDFILVPFRNSGGGGGEETLSKIDISPYSFGKIAAGNENNFGRQPSTVPTDARDPCGQQPFYSEVEV